MDDHMAMPLRIEYPNALYHVTSHGNARNKIFISDQDRENFLFVLNAVIKKYSWLCHAYCLMDNHYHLMIFQDQTLFLPYSYMYIKR